MLSLTDSTFRQPVLRIKNRQPFLLTQEKLPII